MAGEMVHFEMLVKDEGGATVTKPFVFEAEDEA